MTLEQQKNIAAITRFMREHYTDARLAELLAHAQDGKLSFYSCCCFVGIVTATHALRSGAEDECTTYQDLHLPKARILPGAFEAEEAFEAISFSEERRREILIPLIVAEIERRDRAKQSGDIARSLMSEMEVC